MNSPFTDLILLINWTETESWKLILIECEFKEKFSVIVECTPADSVGAHRPIHIRYSIKCYYLNKEARRGANKWLAKQGVLSSAYELIVEQGKNGKGQRIKKDEAIRNCSVFCYFVPFFDIRRCIPGAFSKSFELQNCLSGDGKSLHFIQAYLEYIYLLVRIIAWYKFNFLLTTALYLVFVWFWWNKKTIINNDGFQVNESGYHFPSGLTAIV